MLLELKVKNLGIIEDIDWHLQDGLNIITGETGAGKSLILDAVEILLTGSAGEEVIRHGASEAYIEGVFSLSNFPNPAPLFALLSERGISYEDHLLIITCEIRRQKPGLVRLNGHSVTRALLRSAGNLLVDIHGQSEHLSLLDKKKHLDFLDAFAGNMGLRQNYTSMVKQFKELESKLSALDQKETDSLRREEFLKYQIAEIQKANLHPDEDEELEKERQLITHSHKLKEHCNKIYEVLSGGDPGSRISLSTLAGINEARQSLKKLVEMDADLSPYLDYLEKSFFGLEELARDIRNYGDKLDHNPKRLDEIESRLELIRNLKRKYGKTLTDILGYISQAEQELRTLNLLEEERELLEARKIDMKTKLGEQAFQLSEKRSMSAPALSAVVNKELQTLEMGQMQFAVSIRQNQAAEGIQVPGGQTWSFTEDGADDVEFLVSTNPGEPLKSLVKVASTGEISRFTLALKAALSNIDDVPVLIFDEIDIGVGGRSGDILGKKLFELSRRHQVICVTHLPQIAAYADAHYRVCKKADSSRTISIMEELTENDCILEIAAMLAGHGFSDAAHLNALDLLQKAKEYKNSFLSREEKISSS